MAQLLLSLKVIQFDNVTTLTSYFLIFYFESKQEFIFGLKHMHKLEINHPMLIKVRSNIIRNVLNLEASYIHLHLISHREEEEYDFIHL